MLSAVHCEHGIRGGESLADMRFVQETCEAWNVPLFLFSADCPSLAKAEKVSLETAARNFRLQCFAYLIEQNKADFIATAHHLNDEAETVLFRLARGASLSGVVGMVETNGYFIRPFLNRTRAEIVAYAKENGLVWREDKTNFETDATRNKLRLEILPKLENAVAGATGNLVRFASLADEDDTLLYELAEKLLTQEEDGYAVAFCDKKPLFRRACLLALKGLGVDRDYTALHLENLCDLQKLERGAKQSLPKAVEAKKTETGILLYKKKLLSFVEKKAEEKFTKKGFDGGRYEVTVSKTPVNEFKNGWRVLRLDGEKIPDTAVFRFRKEGDYIQRFGGGKKSLKKFFNEEKIPVDEREYLPLIAEKDGSEVYAVCGVEISERVKVTETTKETLYLILQKK